jgi:hypothetical protein
VAVALATAPAPGGAVDQGAVSAFLADIDALLSDVNALASEAPPEVQASLEAMRNALVKEAIDFSEAVQRAAPAEALPQPAPAARRAPPGVRVVSVATQGEIDLAQAEAKRQRRAYVLLGVVAVIAAIYHGYGYLERAKIARDERPTRSSAPPGAMVAPHGSDRAPVMVRSKDGAPFSAEELSRIQSEEALRGNLVRETSPGAVLILPQGGANGPPSPATR